MGREAFFHIEPRRLPGVDRLQPIAHQVARIDQELLASIALDVRELRIIFAKRQAPERDMARLVLHDIGVDLRRQPVPRIVANALEGG